ncbi:hypothetical protein E2C01_023386 [Portunus trituberculatus]|uniref:Uncharacterized protein n=1 Tax=Portunus trituberculatus TaxID=210409 RepID=A0A5B7E9U7_PORTR|nr:hypothetical protein [Portunus trituberculatus]
MEICLGDKDEKFYHLHTWPNTHLMTLCTQPATDELDVYHMIECISKKRFIVLLVSSVAEAEQQDKDTSPTYTFATSPL